jgi:hypothetical protein
MTIETSKPPPPNSATETSSYESDRRETDEAEVDRGFRKALGIRLSPTSAETILPEILSSHLRQRFTRGG